jgi:hypothetical protein
MRIGTVMTVAQDQRTGVLSVGTVVINFFRNDRNLSGPLAYIEGMWLQKNVLPEELIVSEVGRKPGGH